MLGYQRSNRGRYSSMWVPGNLPAGLCSLTSLALQFDRKSVECQSSEEDADESLTVPSRPMGADEVLSLAIRLYDLFRYPLSFRMTNLSISSMTLGGRNLRLGLRFHNSWAYVPIDHPLFRCLTGTSQDEKVIFFYDDDGKLAAGAESQIPPHLLPEDPDEYVAITLSFSAQLTTPTSPPRSPDVICASFPSASLILSG